MSLFLGLCAQAEDRFGNWAEIGIEKSLGTAKKWSVGLETEMRAQEQDRWSIGANVGFKPIKYLKLGATYNFLYRYKTEKRREHYIDDYVSEDYWNGYNEREDYWSPRHRVSFDVMPTVKLWKWLRISLRERYQYTRRMESTAEDFKYRYSKVYNGSGDFIGYEMYDGYPISEIDTIGIENDHMLRSRLKLAVDKKGWRFSPFISTEFHNSLNSGRDFNLEKIRSAIGTDYKINKRNEITLAYVLTAHIHDDEAPYERLHERMHAFNIAYNFKF